MSAEVSSSGHTLNLGNSFPTWAYSSVFLAWYHRPSSDLTSRSTCVLIEMAQSRAASTQNCAHISYLKCQELGHKYINSYLSQNWIAVILFSRWGGAVVLWSYLSTFDTHIGECLGTSVFSGILLSLWKHWGLRQFIAALPFPNSHLSVIVLVTLELVSSWCLVRKKSGYRLGWVRFTSV